MPTNTTSPLKTMGGADTIRRNYPVLLKRMERVMDISRTLASTLDLNKLLRTIIRAAADLTDTEAASIMLFDPISGDLRFEATTNEDSANLEGIIIPVEGSIAGWIVTHTEPLVVPDVSRDGRWSSVVDNKTAFVTRSILGVPLQARDKTIGALEAINKRVGVFNDDDAEILQTLAAQAAIAIVNARLFQQSDQIAEMVHELRTPLNSLMATTSLLLRPDLPEAKRADIVKMMQRETARLSRMTTDFLDLARLESGRMRFVREVFDMTELVNECVDVVRPQANNRGVTMQVALEETLPALESDRGKLKQVLLNLLTNAIKYNRENGAITVRAFIQGNKCRVNVKDTGRGIPKDAMAHMFEKFFRVAQTEDSATGTGLGLPIAKKIVEALGGEMGVESIEEVGSIFHFTVPQNKTA